MAAADRLTHAAGFEQKYLKLAGQLIVTGVFDSSAALWAKSGPADDPAILWNAMRQSLRTNPNQSGPRL